MFYKIINSEKYKAGRVMLNYFLIISYVIMVNSCMTTQTFYTSPGSLKTEMLEDINKIELKNGKVIDGKDKLIQLGRNADSTIYLLIWSDDPFKSKESTDKNIANWSKEQISGNDIKKIQMVDSHVNVLLTVLLIFGILLTLTAIGIGTSKMIPNNIVPPIK